MKATKVKRLLVKMFKCMRDFYGATVGEGDEIKAMRAFVEFDKLFSKVDEISISEDLKESFLDYRKIASQILSLWADFYVGKTYDGKGIDRTFVRGLIDDRTDEIWKLTSFIEPLVMREVSGILRVNIGDDSEDAA